MWVKQSPKSWPMRVHTQNRIVSLNGELVTEQKIAVAFSTALRKPVTYVSVPYEGFKASMMGYGMPEWQVLGAMELYRLIEAKAAPMVSKGDLGTILGRAPTSIANFAVRNCPPQPAVGKCFCGAVELECEGIE